MHGPPAPRAPPPPTPLQRLCERAAAAGVLAHAAFLPISVAGMQIALAVAAGALVALRLTGRRVWARSALDLPSLLVCAAAVASLGLGALGGSAPVGWHEATLWRALLAPPVLVSAIHAARGAPGEGGDDAAARRLALAALGVWAGASLLASAVSWAQYWTGVDPLHALGLREEAVHADAPRYPGRFAALGFFRWYQRLAHNLTPVLLVAAGVALGAPGRKRLRGLLAVAAAAASSAVVLTLSRAAWVSLAAALVALAVLVGGRRRRWALPAAALLCLALAVHPAVHARLAHLGVQGDNDDRKHIWTVCRAVIADHPLTGVGWGNLPQRSVPYYDRLAPWNPLRAWCHDSFLSAWAEGGPLLFAALAAWWALLLRAFWRARSAAAGGLERGAAAGAIAATLAMLANSLVHDILYSSEASYALAFALAAAAVLARAGSARGALAAGAPSAPVVADGARALPAAAAAGAAQRPPRPSTSSR